MAARADVVDVRRRLRLLAVLDAAEEVGLTPLPLLDLHTVGYFADALSPVWDLRIVEAQRLKRFDGPMSPRLQAEIDHLVGRGLVVPSDVAYVATRDGGRRLEARYALNHELAARVLETAAMHEGTARQLHFAKEVVFALSALGGMSPSDASSHDAAYGDPVVDTGDLLDLARDGSTENRTARVALRFGELMRDQVRLSESELIHLYVRALYERLPNAA